MKHRAWCRGNNEVRRLERNITKCQVTIGTEETEPLSQTLTESSAHMEDLAAGPHVSVVLTRHRPAAGEVCLWHGGEDGIIHT